MIVQGLLLLDPASAPEPGWLRLSGDRIEEVHPGSPPSRPDLGSPRDIVTPAFLDAHVHLPQIDSVGCDGLELLEWLDRIIFPAETWLMVYCRRQFEKACRELERSLKGT